MVRKKWKYHSENLPGNLHVAARFISDHNPEWDVVTMKSSGWTTIVIWLEEMTEEDEGQRPDFNLRRGD